MPSATVPGSTGSTTDPDTSAAGADRRRRRPAQARSRERVERILDAASRLVIEVGVDGLTTRSIAEAAELPVASLYQYFADKESVLLAICERDMAEMDDQVARDLADLAPDAIAIDTLVRTAMRAFVAVYERRPAFMRIWMRGRTNAAIYDYGRHHNKRIAGDLLAFGTQAGLVDTTSYDERELARIAELAVEVGDRAFQLAYEQDPRGDAFVIEQAISMVSDYLRRIAAPTEGTR